MAIHFMRGNFEGVLVIKLADGDAKATVDYIHSKWDEFNIEYPFEYTWMDEEFDKLFDTERQTSKILAIFSILCIILTCLGLLGLISYTTNQRTREIGIRKIMGASVQIIMRLLSKEVFLLLGISALISIPAYFVVGAWLQRFAYHIQFQLAIYMLVLGAVVLTVLILSIATVSFHSYKAATSNPADTLKMD